jgi:hypothetical protein
VLLAVVVVALGATVASAGVDAPLNLYGKHLFGPCKVKAPSPRWVEPVLCCWRGKTCSKDLNRHRGFKARRTADRTAITLLLLLILLGVGDSRL